MGCNASNLRINFSRVKTDSMPNKETALISSRIEKRIIGSERIISLINEWKTFEIYTETAKNATSENLMKAFDQMTESLKKINEIYSFAQKLSEEFLELILLFLVNEHKRQADPDVSIEQRVSENWTLLAKLAESLSMILDLDAAKSLKPEIQNELSIFKRFFVLRENQKDDFNNNELIINDDTIENGENSSESFNDTKNELRNEIRSELRNEDGEKSDLKVSVGKEDEISNEKLQKWTMPEGMSANCLEDFSNFFSNPTPFIGACVKSIIPILNKEDNMFMDDIIQFIPNIYLAALKCKDTEKVNVGVFEDAIVTSAVMVDRLLPEGIFHKNSGVKVAEIISYLRGKNSNRGTLLIRQLKFGSMHFNDETTPKSLRNMF